MLTFSVARIHCLLCIFLLVPLFSTHPTETINGKPVKVGTWKGITGEYLAGEIIVKINREANRNRVDSVLSVNGLSVIIDFDYRGWGVVGCDTSVNIFQKMDILATRPDLIEHVEPNGVLRFCLNF